MKLIDLAVKELDCWPGGQWLVQNPNDGQWRAFSRNLPQLRLAAARNKDKLELPKVPNSGFPMVGRGLGSPKLQGGAKVLRKLRKDIAPTSEAKLSKVIPG